MNLRPEPTFTTSRGLIFQQVEAERKRQDAKWGEQNHPSVVSPEEIEAAKCKDVFEFYGVPTEQAAKDSCDATAANKNCTWAHIAIEELCEVLGAENETDRRTELVQLNAVVTAWIEKIDRHAGKP